MKISSKFLLFITIIFIVTPVSIAHGIELLRPADGGSDCVTLLFDWSRVEGDDIRYVLTVAYDENLTDIVDGFPKTVSSTFSADVKPK